MDRLNVKKTYKLYVGGKFPRTGSGRNYQVTGKRGAVLANVSRASGEDVHGAVAAARKALGGWARSTAYLRGQILYRVGEMLEGRSGQFVDELVAQGRTPAAAKKEVAAAIDLIVHYAGWSDKYQAVFSSVNPVASPHYNFSVPEPTGVVAVVAPGSSGLLGLCSVVLASRARPLCAVSFGEVLNSSDVPGGVVNLLTGFADELLPVMSSHMDVNALLLCADDPEAAALARGNAAGNVKRVVVRSDAPMKESPYHILDFTEIKTTWHPVGS